MLQKRKKEEYERSSTDRQSSERDTASNKGEKMPPPNATHTSNGISAKF